MMKQIMLLVGLGIVVATPVNAADLAGALNAGKVCEGADGYIQATSNEAEVADLVANVNAKRASVYADIAVQDGLTPDVVGVEHAREEKAKNPGRFCK